MGNQMTERFSAPGATLVKLFGRPDPESAEFAVRADRVRQIGVRMAMRQFAFVAALTLVAATQWRKVQRRLKIEFEAGKGPGVETRRTERGLELHEQVGSDQRARWIVEQAEWLLTAPPVLLTLAAFFWLKSAHHHSVSATRLPPRDTSMGSL